LFNCLVLPEFAAYLLPFKHNMPIPILEQIQQDVLDHRYVVGVGSVEAPAKPSGGKKKRGPVAVADDDSADTARPALRSAIVDEDDDAPPTPPRSKSKS
jgi:hypothetical protein